MSCKYKLLFSFLILNVQLAMAQPTPCGEPAEMTSLCPDACIICDIDGFEGRHESNVSGWLPDDFCTTTVHNAQWIAFQAGSTNLTIQLDVSNCIQGYGLEITIYEGIDCDNYKMVSNCLGNVQNGTQGVITTSEPLTIGQYYYLVMDGNWGDNCDWKLTVLDGDTQVDPLDTSGDILGDGTVCPEMLHQFELDFPIGATEFDWTVNGILLNENTSILNYEFPNDGTYQVCVTASNACDVGPPSCRDIIVESVPVTEIIDVFCENDCYVVAGDTICQTGTYEYILQNIEGCDSIVTADLTELPTPYLAVDIDICEGDTILIGNSSYTQTGIFQESLVTPDGCDSIIDLDLFVIICEIVSSDFPSPAICQGAATGQIMFNVDNGTPPFTYTWQNLNNTHSGNGNIGALNEMIAIENIPKGTYLITIEDTFGNSDIIISEVTEPTELTLDFITSDYNGTNVSCDSGTDGMLEAIVSGGVPPYTYEWSNSQNTASINNLSAIVYNITVTDDVGCVLEGDYTLTEPDPIFMSASYNNTNCDGLNTGFIEITQTMGGAPPYTYFLDGVAQGASLIYEDLFEGTYAVEVMDANGCVFEILDFVSGAQIPQVDLGEDFSVTLGNTVYFDPSLNNVTIQSIEWAASELLSCEDCLNPESTPLFSGNYILEVTSEDGCSALDSVFITVDKFRKFYAPNAFSPNADGFNDYFTLYGSSEVAMIKKLQVFNRWGAVVFEGSELPPQESTAGWNGQFKGKTMNPDVFTWLAEVEFIDGVVETYSGDVSIVL